MNIDSFLKIGHSHTICQDYILTGDDPCPYIILADGCSQSEDSDIGARILCHTAATYLRRNRNYLDKVESDQMGNSIILDAGFISSAHFTVKTECLDSTLIVAYKFKDKYYIHMYGDGLIYLVDKKGVVQHCQIRFEPNAPFYLRYQLNGMDDYEKSQIVKTLDCNRGCFSEMVSRKTRPYCIDFDANYVKTLMVASDGVESIVFKEETLYKTLYLDLLSSNKRKTDLPKTKEFKYQEVLESFSDFKLTKGAFLKRRVKKVLKEYLKLGFVNDDDLSIGCFYEE